MAPPQNEACHQSGVRPTERLMVRWHDTSLGWTRETYYELLFSSSERSSLVISSSDDEAFDNEDTFKQERIDEIDADEDIALVSTHDGVSTQDNIVQDEGIQDVSEEEVVEVVSTAKMIIDAIVDAALVTTAIVDILVSAAKTEVTTAPTITAEC
nr:hypothetical protein [Tanacetum cinerariifolium]